MKILKLLGRIILCFLSLYGCTQQEQKSTESTAPPTGTPAYYYEQGLATSDLDLKLQAYNKGLQAVTSRKDSNLVALLEGKVYVLVRKRELEKSRPWIDSLIRAAEYQKDTFFLAKGYYRRSLLNNFLNKPELEFKNAFLARQLSLKAGDTSSAARRSFDMANAQMDMGDYPGSQRSATEALRYLDQDRDSIFISAAHNLIGLAYLNQGFNEDAIREYRNALQFAARTEDSLTFLHNIAIALKNEKKYDEALDILKEIVQSDAPDISSKSRFLDNLAYTTWLKDSTARVDSLFMKALEMRQEVNDLRGLQTSYSHLADYYKNKDRQKAIEYAKASVRAAQQNSSAMAEVEALKKLIGLLEGEDEKEYVDRYIHLHDSLDKASLKAKFYFAKIRFDEQRKQQQIDRLENENLKQELQAERLQFRNVLLSLGAMLILLTALLYFYYQRQKSRRERIREAYLTESRISKRIHDELANDMYSLMGGLESEASEENMEKLDNLYQRTRDISSENSEIETGDEFVPGLLANLSNNSGEAKVIVHGEHSIPWENVSEEKKVVVYRVLQELMINMKKHSTAELAAITFTLENNYLVINYKDNGKGCDLSSTGSGNGLRNASRRVASVKGDFEYHSERGNGFSAKIRLRF